MKPPSVMVLYPITPGPALPLTAELSLAAPHAAPLGRDRVRLLEAVGREGSISAAARALGLSYKTAWDAICAMNNLVGRPLVTGQTGGRRGGGALLTPEGKRLIASFHRVETEMARVLHALEPELTGVHPVAALSVLRTSARNALRGTITAIAERAVDAEVRLRISPAHTLLTLVTRQSLRDLDLAPGQPAIALIKAPFVRLSATPDPSAANCLPGRIAHVDSGPLNAEITLDIGEGKTLCAITNAPFAPDTPACAMIAADHIILAVE